MKERLRFLLYYFLFWFIFFGMARLIFLGFHIEDTKKLTVEMVGGIIKNGAKMDLSMAGYLSVIPFILVALSNFIKKGKLVGWIFTYTFAMVFIILLIIIADLQVYNVWHYRIDSTPLHYLSTPKEAFASISGMPYFAMFISFLIMLFSASFIIYRIITKVIDDWGIVKKREFMPVVIFLTISLIIPIRGGFQLSPINQSSVYFSENHFANVSAINATWNFLSSITNNTKEKINPYIYLPKEALESLLKNLFTDKSKLEKKLNPAIKNPNVLLIVWESFTEKATKLEGVTPNFNRLKQEGIYFSNIYASGDRTDKGLVAIFSGYPAQPATSIITTPNKAQKLPVLSKDFAAKNYHTSFYYGGETEFANIKAYLYGADFDKIISKHDFEPKDWNSKWGTHDHITYNRLLTDLSKQQQPFFSTMLTLSSHEPFETPTKPVILGEDETSKFLNSMHYADESLGSFITEAQKQAWWKNTLVVIIADHGHTLPANADKTQDFRIPMLWLGGALNEKGTVKANIGSQTDLAQTLAGQFDLKGQQYEWSKNLLTAKPKEWAYFAFNDGFGFIQPKKQIVFDNVGKKPIQQQGLIKENDINAGKAILQRSFQDYLEK